MKKLIGVVDSLVKSVIGYEIKVKRIKKKSGVKKITKSLRTSLNQILNHFASIGFEPLTIIDVGVGYGTNALYNTKFPNNKILLIEPLKEFQTILEGICEKCNAEYVIAAAGDHNGFVEICVHRDIEGSSIFGDAGIKRKVPIITLDSECEKRSLKGPYISKADVQGAELKVLDGASTILNDTDVVILEVSLFRFDNEYPDFYDVVYYMKQRGFVVYEIFGGHNRPLDGARAQADLVFVKENGRFRKSHMWATNEQLEEFYTFRRALYLEKYSS